MSELIYGAFGKTITFRRNSAMQKSAAAVQKRLRNIQHAEEEKNQKYSAKEEQAACEICKQAKMLHRVKTLHNCQTKYVASSNAK